jgi:curved DNA-binding protein CbpA
MPQTHYDNLQVSRKASDRVIRAAYKSLSQQWHPDKHPHDKDRAEKITKIINEAYRVLSDPNLRREHDAWITREEHFQSQEKPYKEPKARNPSSDANTKNSSNTDYPFPKRGINDYDEFGFTPLMQAVGQKDVAAVKNLLEIGADPKKKGNYSATPSAGMGGRP